MDIRKILSLPAIYSSYIRLVGGHRFRQVFIGDYVKPQSKSKILDIGCGPGDVLEYLPGGVEYFGFDMDEGYIAAAKEKSRQSKGAKGEFVCARVSEDTLPSNGDFDIVIAGGVLHHLDDQEALSLFRLASAALRVGGRLVTVDGCYVENQSRFARILLGHDRGHYVRTEAEYIKLARQVFPDVRSSIRHDLLRIPYTHIMLDCPKR